MIERRSGRSSSVNARATSSTMVVGRNAPASSRDSVVSRSSSAKGARGVAASIGGVVMILANVRGRLRGPDFRLVILALSRGDARQRARSGRFGAEKAPAGLPEGRGLLGGLLGVGSRAVPSPPLFTYVAVRHVLLAAGIVDPELADYLAALLLEFGDHGRHAKIRPVDDESYHYLVDIVADLADEDDSDERGLLLRAHLGNYSLWLAGLFPDYIAARRTRAGGPDLPYYDELGRQGYRLASQHRLAERFGVASIYPPAAAPFPPLRQALNPPRAPLFLPAVSPPAKILRKL